MAYLGNSLGIGSSAVSAAAVGGYIFTNTRSIVFDSVDDSVEVSGFDATTLIGSGNVSAAAWVKADTADTGLILHIGADDYPTNSNYISLSYLNGIGFRVNARTGTTGVASATYSVTITTNTWYHVGFTRTGTTTKLYVNGVLRDTTTNAENGVTVGDTLIIGNLPARTVAWDGNIAMLHIWDSVLTDGNFSSLYNSGDPINPTTIASGNVIAAFPFEEGTGTDTEDISTNGNDGTLTNGPTWSTDVPVYVFNRYSVDFDGTDDYANVDALATDLASDTTGTIAFFVKPDTISTSSTDCLVVVGNGSNSYVQISQYDGDIFVNGFVSGSSKYTLLTDDAVLSTSAFKHVMVTHDGTRPRIYIDNVEVASTFTTDVDRTVWIADVVASTFRIGQNPFSGGVNWFGGLIDELVVLRSEATSEQRTALYGAGVATDVSSLSPYTWLRMGDNDGGTGTTITDQGSGGNDATLTNGPTFSTDVPT